MSASAPLDEGQRDWRRRFAPALERLGGDTELFLDLAEMFLEDSVQLNSAANAKLSANDYDGAARDVHNLKGLAANFDHHELASKLDCAERLAQSEEGAACGAELQRAEPFLAELVADLTAILRHVRSP
jgi:HPt (histidine-containing phosphotransfer) domain-containing protein